MQELLSQLDNHRRKVDFDTFDISAKELVSMAEQEIIDVAPEYQRHFRWPEDNQSRFIESVFLGIPVPSLFMAANKDGTWELIDGVQRLNSLIHFIGNDDQLDKFEFKSNLKLSGLEILTEFNGALFKDLPQSLQLKFALRPLKVTTLSDKSDLKVRFDLFERLNTGGIRLTEQEIRACVFRGEFNDFLKELAKDEDFNAVVNTKSTAETDGTREELVLKFFAYFYNHDKFEHSVIEFLNDYMSEAASKFNYKKNRELFSKTFNELRSLLPEGIRRGSRKLTPINLYEAISIGAAKAINEGHDISESNLSDWLNDKELTALTSGATNSKVRLKARIDYCYQRFIL